MFFHLSVSRPWREAKTEVAEFCCLWETTWFYTNAPGCLTYKTKITLSSSPCALGSSSLLPSPLLSIALSRLGFRTATWALLPVWHLHPPPQCLSPLTSTVGLGRPLGCMRMLFSYRTCALRAAQYDGFIPEPKVFPGTREMASIYTKKPGTVVYTCKSSTGKGTRGI